MKILALGALALLALSAPVRATAQDAGVAIGTAAPKTLPVERLDGARADLAQLFGKGPVLLQFWAAWCSSCHELAPKVAAARTKYGDKVKFIGVAVAINQSPTLARRYSEKHRTPLDLYYDRDGAAAEAFEAPGTSYVVLLDAAGKVAYTGFGPDQNLDAAIRKLLAAK
jgi:thiol-disulfide isomerase/thioredoxin